MAVESKPPLRCPCNSSVRSNSDSLRLPAIAFAAICSFVPLSQNGWPSFHWDGIIRVRRAGVSRSSIEPNELSGGGGHTEESRHPESTLYAQILGPHVCESLCQRAA